MISSNRLQRSPIAVVAAAARVVAAKAELDRGQRATGIPGSDEPPYVARLLHSQERAAQDKIRSFDKKFDSLRKKLRIPARVGGISGIAWLGSAFALWGLQPVIGTAATAVGIGKAVGMALAGTALLGMGLLGVSLIVAAPIFVATFVVGSRRAKAVVELLEVQSAERSIERSQSATQTVAHQSTPSLDTRAAQDELDEAAAEFDHALAMLAAKPSRSALERRALDVVGLKAGGSRESLRGDALVGAAEQVFAEAAYRGGALYMSSVDAAALITPSVAA